MGAVAPGPAARGWGSGSEGLCDRRHSLRIRYGPYLLKEKDLIDNDRALEINESAARTQP